MHFDGLLLEEELSGEIGIILVIFIGEPKVGLEDHILPILILCFAFLIIFFVLNLTQAFQRVLNLLFGGLEIWRLSLDFKRQFALMSQISSKIIHPE